MKEETIFQNLDKDGLGLLEDDLKPEDQSGLESYRPPGKMRRCWLCGHVQAVDKTLSSGDVHLAPIRGWYDGRKRAVQARSAYEMLTPSDVLHDPVLSALL